RRGPGRGPGAARRRALRQDHRTAGHRELHGLRHAARLRPAADPDRHVVDALPVEPAGRQGLRRGGRRPPPRPPPHAHPPTRRPRSSRPSPTRWAMRTSSCRRRRKRCGARRRTHRPAWLPNRPRNTEQREPMYPFEYLRARSVSDAAKLLASKPEAKLLAGGHTLLPTMKLRLASPKALVDLGRVTELKGLDRKGNTLVIGAMTTHAEVADSAVVKSAIPGLAVLAGGIGDPHVRHRGTIGGSIANNDPSADYPAALLGLGASIGTN